MSINMWDIWLASLAGTGTYFLLENLYYEIRARIHTRQFNQFLDDLEDEYNVDIQ